MEDIHFRPYRDADYPGFLDCINDFYNNGYPYPDVLVREKIARRLQNKELILTVAVTPDGSIVGTVGARIPHGDFEGGILLILRTVRSGYRGQGIASAQLEDLLARVAQTFTGSKCYYADVMTHDIISQCSLHDRGYTFCGLRLMAYRNEIIVPKLAFRKGTKMSQAVYCKAIDRSPVTLFAPKEHRALIGRIYAELGVKASFAEPAPAPYDGETAYTLESDERNAFTECVIRRAGKDLPALTERLSAIIRSGHTMVAYVNMKDAAATDVYTALCEEGFYFSGISPLFVNGEYLILSHTENCLESFEDIGIYGNKNEVIDYILGGRTK